MHWQIKKNYTGFGGLGVLYLFQQFDKLTIKGNLHDSVSKFIFIFLVYLGLLSSQTYKDLTAYNPSIF